MLEQGGGAGIDELERQAVGFDPEDLPGRIERTNNEIQDCDRRAQELSLRVGGTLEKREQLERDAGAGDAAERGQGLLAALRDGVDRCLRLRLGHSLLHREIERYRSENQDPVLRRAGELFHRLTMGSFTRLEADLDDDGRPLLVGVRGAERVVVEGMSDGARDQLYLSLRLASIERHFERAEPMPIVLDDILVNFDEGRAEAAVGLLAELGQKWQVLLLTHHAHVADMARRRTDGSVRVHDLGD